MTFIQDTQAYKNAVRRHGRRRSSTERILEGMLKENTGRHFLDSGGAHGRHWEQNQGRQFEKEYSSQVLFGSGYIDFRHNLFHFLAERLTYDATMQRRFSRFCSRPENEDLYWHQCIGKFIKAREGVGLYGEGEPWRDNTYNSDNLVSQDYIYTYWEEEGGDYVFIEIHGGCDARGGYTAPKVFVPNEETSFLDYNRGTIQCQNSGKRLSLEEGRAVEWTPNNLFPELVPEETQHYWDTDDGAHWYYQGACGYRAGRQLETFSIVEWNEVEEEGLTPGTYGMGVILVDSWGFGYCPLCGGKLEAY